MIQVKQKGDKVDITIKGITQEELGFIQSLVGERDEKLLKRANKYQKEISRKEFESVPKIINELFLQIIINRIYEEQ